MFGYDGDDEQRGIKNKKKLFFLTILIIEHSKDLQKLNLKSIIQARQK